MKVLVTGGSGFIGSWISNKLYEEGYKVSILDIKDPPKRVNYHSFIKGDIRNESLVVNALKHIDCVIHLAALISVEESISKPMLYHDVNVIGTLNLLNASVKMKVEKFIYISSAAVYGNPQYLPIDEKHPLRPLSPYGASKASGELYVLTYNNAYNLHTVILRLFNVYGPRNEIRYSSVIDKFVIRALRNKPLIIYGDGQQTRDFIFIDDVADAIARSIDVDEAINEIINIGCGKPVTIKDLARTILTLTGRDIPIMHVKARTGDIRHSYADIRKAMRILRWKPRYSLKRGLERTIECYKVLLEEN